MPNKGAGTLKSEYWCIAFRLEYYAHGERGFEQYVHVESTHMSVVTIFEALSSLRARARAWVLEFAACTLKYCHFEYSNETAVQVNHACMVSH